MTQETGLDAAPEAASSSPAPAADASAHDAATRDDVEFNRVFSHEFADVADVRMHYVTGGDGPPLVLLHGWPQSWYAWRGPVAQNPFSDRQVEEFTRTYARPQVLTGGFELYRTLDQDEADNAARSPLTVPTMLMTGEGSLATTLPTLESSISTIVREVEVPGAGHWLMQENPDFVTTELLAFLDRPATRTTSP